MLKSFVMSLALMGLGATAVGSDAPTPQMSTWRWHVSQALDAQQAGSKPLATVGTLDAASFDQQYLRYTVSGAPAK